MLAWQSVQHTAGFVVWGAGNMGYSYDAYRRLCCDICGQPDGVRKHKCPSGYCPAVAAHLACLKTVKQSGKWAEIHKHCPVSAAKYAAKEARRAALLGSGQPVRFSALDAGPNGVRVVFKVQGSPDVAFHMAPETYDAIPLGEPATPDDYRAFGSLEPCPATFDDLYSRAGQ